MADNGPASGNGELNAGSFPTSVFLEVHTQNNVQSAITSGVPGGTAGPASGLNNLGPGDIGSFVDATAYGTVPSGAAVSAINVTIGGSGGNSFRLKNPA